MALALSIVYSNGLGVAFRVTLNVNGKVWRKGSDAWLLAESNQKRPLDRPGAVPNVLRRSRLLVP